MSEPGEVAPGAGAALPRWRVFPPVALGVIMATLDASVVNIALPTISRQFQTTLTAAVWVMLAYSTTITGLLLTAGRLADLRGRRGIYAAGVALFTLASALCGAAPTVGWLVAARVLQGIGAALVSANGTALLVAAFPANERGKALGAFGAMVGIGLMIGAPLGGIVVQHASWRWLFYANLPLGLLTLWLVRARVPADGPLAHAPRLDLAAAATWCGALVALMVAITRGRDLGWRSPFVLLLFAIAALLLGGFALLERRTEHPMLPVRILAGPLGVAVTLTLLSQALTMAVSFQVPLFFEEVLHFNTQRSGMWSALPAVFALFFAPVAGRLSDRFGARLFTTLGLALAVPGFVVLSGMGVRPALGHVVLGLGLIGAGMGLFTAPNTSALMSLVPRDRLGIAAGLQNTTRYLGFALGAAVTGVLVDARYLAHTGRVHSGGLPASPEGLAAATHDAFLVMAAVAVVATLIAASQRPARLAA